MLLLYAIAAPALLWLTFSVLHAFRKDLRVIPGPYIARFTRFYRYLLISNGKGPEQYRELHGRYGPVVRTGPNHVSFADPEAIPVIYGIASKFLKTPFYGTMTPEYQGERMESIFTERDPAEHKALKTPVAQFFALSSMKLYEPYVDECNNIFQAAMEDLEGQTLDLAKWLQWYAFDVIASITFQRRFGFMEERKDVHNMIAGLDTGLDFIKFLGNYPELDAPMKAIFRRISPYLPERYRDPLVRFVTMSEDEITRYDASEKSVERTDFLSQLREKSDRFSGNDSKRVIVNHLANNLLAGSDTTAISLRACFYYLVKNPRTLACLREEIRRGELDGTISNPVTLDESLKMPYLQAVMKEAMRLHPGVGFPLERFVPPAGAEICGVTLQGGTNVSVVAPVVQLDKSIFGQDADVFRPERWIECDKERGLLMQRTMIAFGSGGRTCIGKNISIMEMGKFIPQVFRTFDIEWASSKPTWNTNAAWFWKQHDMHCRFVKRS